MMPLDFDELNDLVGFKRSQPFNVYFGEMRITPDERKRRIDIAERFEDGFLDILAWCFYTQQSRNLPESEVKGRVRGVFETALGSEIKRLDETDRMIKDLSKDIARTTVKRGKEDPFFVSADRARLISEDTANHFANYLEFDIARRRGLKWKTWNTILDGRERITHNFADGQMQPIGMPFEVGSSLLMFPHDTSLGADLEEIISCRCSLSFS